MIEILIVDDSPDKIASIKDALLTVEGITPQSFDTADCVNEAKRVLALKKYDLLLLDIQLPNRRVDTPKPDAGVLLLRRIFEVKRFLVPTSILGITSFEDIFEQVSQEFDEKCVSIIKYDRTSSLWKTQLINKATQTLEAKISSRLELDSRKHLVITIHGIRTFGQWQNKVELLLRRHASKVEVRSYKYGYFSILVYFFPFLRSFIVRRFRQELNSILKDNRYNKIDILAHSFGTYIAAFALKGVYANPSPFRRLILCGSVLKSGFDWGAIFTKHTAMQVTNDCGASDAALLLNNMLVPYSGMAGRFGFNGAYGNKVVNRIFLGDHSHYFTSATGSNNDFIEHRWIPILITDDAPESIDERPTPSFLYGAFITLAQIASFERIFTICVISYLLFKNGL